MEAGNEEDVDAEESVRHRDGLWARTANLLASGWLVVSAFAWEASGAQRTNAAVVAYLVFVFSMVATGLDAARALNTLLGIWLLVSVWILPPASAAMRWNTGLIAVAVILFSLVSKQGALRPPLPGRLEPPRAHAH